jgi:hypothetical protein
VVDYRDWDESLLDYQNLSQKMLLMESLNYFRLSSYLIKEKKHNSPQQKRIFNHEKNFHRTTDYGWHGASLAVAEHVRRGLLLPEQLEQLMPLLIKSLHYDERRGTHSRGSNVRDAGCYVSWGLARAYEPHILRDHFKLALASALLITAVFDRFVS